MAFCRIVGRIFLLIILFLSKGEHNNGFSIHLNSGTHFAVIPITDLTA